MLRVVVLVLRPSTPIDSLFRMAKRKVIPGKYPERTGELPVTQSMLYLVRDELKSNVLSLNQKWDSVDSRLQSHSTCFGAVDMRFESMDRRFDSIDARFESMDRRFDSIDVRFESIDRRFDAIDLKFVAVDKRFDALEAKMDGRFNELMGEIHRVGLLVEEQNARNAIVLDGLTSLFQRQERLEAKIAKLSDL